MRFEGKAVALACALLGACGGSTTSSGGGAAIYSISGTANGATAAGVNVSLGGAMTGTTITDASGNYTFTGLLNGSYTVTPSKSGFTFSPASLAVTVSGANVAAQNFTATASTTGGLVITIQNLNFSPLDMTVPPGATVTVQNLDGIDHSVTSEAAKGSFTPGGVGGVSFDTGLFSSGSRTFTIPANAPTGTVIPYYCRSHLQLMPQGTITVNPNATPSQTPTQTPSSPMPVPY